MLLDAFHFLRPMWLIALIPLLALAWYWVKRTQSGSGWEATIDDNLLVALLDAGHKRSNRWLRTALLVSLIGAAVGLAGPTWQKLPQNVEQKNDALVILLDLSLSMLAQDIKPSRVERARQKITDVLRLRDEGQTALIAYAGDAHAVVPLTDDTATITNLLVSLSPEMMPVFGSNPGHALTLAKELFENALIQQGRVLMVTDGIDNINSVSRHRSRAYPISIIGIGTEAGGPIPLDRVRQPGRFLNTQEGNRIIAILDQSRLSEVAGMTYGNYAKAEVGDADLLHALAVPLPGEDETIDVEREFDTWFDQGHWAALLLIPLLLMGFRKGVLLCLFVGVMLPSPPVYANPALQLWEGLWQRSDQRGAAALRHGEPEKAVTLFEDHEQWRSAAQYRSGDYVNALSGFRNDPGLTGRYNQGNALARMGEYEAALAQYDQVLSARPGHEDAAFNKDLIERLLQEQQQAQQQQNQDQQSQANNDSSDQQQSDQQNEQDQSDQQQQSEDSEQRENEESQSEPQEEQGEQQQTAQAQQDEASRDEKQDALEQWLRRVPDDPGGLLRRKFSHETKQRLRRGDFENRQGDKIW